MREIGSSSSSSGVGFFGLLTVAFVVLKLTKYIDWSWFWVLSPVIIPVIVGLTIGVLYVIYRVVRSLKKGKPS